MLKFRFKEGESLNRWLVSQVKESYYYSEPKSMEGELNPGCGFIVTEYPCRTQFLQDDKISRVRYEDSENLEFQLYVPFENRKVEFSRFNHEPTYLRFFSKNLISADKPGKINFKLGTTGGVKIWVNGEEAHVFKPYNRNHMTYENMELNLEKGENEILIYCDDLAERDINYYFEIVPQEEIEVIIPISAEQEEISQVEKAFQEIYFSKDCYSSEDVKLIFPKELEKDLKLDFYLKSGDPVNNYRNLTGKSSVKKGEREAILFNTSEYPIGFYKVFITGDVQGAKLTRMLTMENYNNLSLPILEELEERKRYSIIHIAEHGDDTLDKVLAIMLAEGFTARAEEIFEQEIQLVEKNHDCADFSLFTLIYMYKKCKEMLPPTVHKRIKAALLKFRYWIDEPGNDCMWYFSENHALCLHGAEFLAGELFPEEIFSGGIKGEDHIKKGKERLLDWFEEFFRYGLGEWNSVTYIPIDLIGFFGLNMLAEDEEIRALAKKALDYIFSILGDSFHSGITSSSYGRVYEKELKGQLTNECSSINWIAFGKGYLNNKLRASTLFAISDYSPAGEILEKTVPGKEGKSILSVQGKELVKLYSYKTAKFSLSSAIDYRRRGEGHQESIVHVNIADSVQSQLWISHPGEEVPSGEGRPSFWAGNGRLPDVIQIDNMIFLDYKLERIDRVHFTHMYCDVASYEEIRIEGRKGYLRKNGVNILIFTRRDMRIVEDGPTSFREIRVDGDENYWFLLIDDKMEFQDFREKYADISVEEEEKLSESMSEFVINLLEQKIKISFSPETILLNGKEYLELWKKQ